VGKGVTGFTFVSPVLHGEVKSLLPLEGVSPEGLIGLWIALRAMNYNAALRLTPSGSLRSPPTPYIGVGKGVTGFTFVSPVLHDEVR
jgi:hypothetical protein